MVGNQRYYKLGILFCLVASAIALDPAVAQTENPLDRLPVQERVTLREGNPVVGTIDEGQSPTGGDRTYLGRVLVPAPARQIWQVLVDYENFPSFWPDVEAYNVLTSEQRAATATTPAQTIREVESTSTANVLLGRITSTNRLKLVETPVSRIDFSLLASQELDEFVGYWLLESANRYATSSPQILVTYQLTASPHSLAFGLFDRVVRSQIIQSLQTVRQETLRRTGTTGDTEVMETN
jgi:ribosome-associated toxin RatA of RatAB toxin-antitoxin module